MRGDDNHKMSANNKVRVLPLWIILWLLTGPIIYIRNGIAHGNLEFGRVLFMGVITAIPLVVAGLVLWGILSLIYKAVAPGQKISLKVALGVWFVIFVGLFMIPLFKKDTGVSTPQVSKEYKYGVSVFNAINDERAREGLPNLQIDENLCAFARKKALDYARGNPQQKSFSDEVKDPANDVYFSGYGSIVMDSIEGGLLSGDEEFAQDFTSRKGEGAASLGITHGCVADSTGSGAEGGKFYTVFVGAAEN
jgi:hypothetical protein